MQNQQTHVDQELLLDFFLTFSRFEYALKDSDFFQRSGRNYSHRHQDANPDWDSFAVSLRGVFRADSNDELQRACEYISDSPPDKQVIIDDAVDWETPTRPENESEIEFLLRMVRSIRNNLFHGGKHSTEPHEEVNRTERLLNVSLIILHECLNLAPDVNNAFLNATL